MEGIEPQPIGQEFSTPITDLKKLMEDNHVSLLKRNTDVTIMSTSATY